MSQAIMIAWVIVMTLIAARAWIVLRLAKDGVVLEEAIRARDRTIAELEKSSVERNMVYALELAKAASMLRELELKVAAYEQALKLANET